jgi:hypothetical protein
VLEIEGERVAVLSASAAATDSSGAPKRREPPRTTAP